MVPNYVATVEPGPLKRTPLDQRPRPYRDRGHRCGLRVFGQYYLTVLLSIWGESTILANFSPPERMLTLFCNEKFKLEAGFTVNETGHRQIATQ